MLPDPMTAALIVAIRRFLLLACSRTWTRSRARRGSRRSRRRRRSGASVRARRSSPRRPARSGMPRAQSVSASQRAALSGWPRQAAPLPVDTSSPLIDIDIVIERRSTADSGTRPATEHVEAAAGVVGDGVDEPDVPAGDPAVDDLDRRAGRTPSPGRSRRTRGARRRGRVRARWRPRPRPGAAGGARSARARRRRPPCRRTACRSPARSTPSCSWTAGDVRPILRPLTRRPPSRSSWVLTSCTA